MANSLNLTNLFQDVLPLELSELYSQLEGNLDFLTCFTLAKKYLSNNNLFNTISLIEKALHIVSSQPKGSVNIKEIVICSVFILTLPSQRGFRQEHFERVQTILNEAAQRIRSHIPFHPILPTLKGFWYFFNDKTIYAQYYFRKSLKRTPINAFATIGMALSHFRLGNYEQALNLFLRCTLFTNNGQSMPVVIMDYRLGIALCHLELKNDKVALNILNNIVKQSPDCLEASLLISMLQLRQLQKMNREHESSILEEKVQSLLKKFDSIFGSHQIHPGLALLLGETHFLARNYDQAYSFVQQALGQDSQTSIFRTEAYFLTGKILYAEGEFTEARRFISQVLVLNKDHTPAAILLSLLDFQEGELDEAINRLTPIVSLNNNNVSLETFNRDLSLKALYVAIQARLSLFVSDSNLQLDVTDLKKFTILFNECSTHQEDLVAAALLDFTSACEHRHEWAQAASNLTSILDIFSERHCSNECLIRLTKCVNNAAVAFMLNENKFDSVNRLLKSAFEYAEKIKDTSAQFLVIPLKYNSALILEKFGRTKEAKDIYETLNNDAPAYFNAKLKLGLFAQHEKDNKKALFLYDSVIESAKAKNLKEIVIKGLLLKGVLYHNRSSFTQARHSFKRVLADFDSDNIVALIYVGFNYLILARQAVESAQRKEYYREATQYFRRVHNNHPNNPYPISGIGCILSDQHDYSTAVKIFKEIGGRVEYSVNIANLAHCHFRLGNFEEAALMYGNAVNSCTHNKYSLIQAHARALYAIGIQKKCRLNILKSIEELRKAIQLNTNEPSLKFNLGLALQFFGQLVCDREATDITEYRVERAIRSVEESKEIFQKLQIFAMSNKTIYPPPLVDSRLGFCTTLLSKLEMRLVEERKRAALEKPFQVEKFETYQPTQFAPGSRQSIKKPTDDAEIPDEKDELNQDEAMDEEMSPQKDESFQDEIFGDEVSDKKGESIQNKMLAEEKYSKKDGSILDEMMNEEVSYKKDQPDQDEIMDNDDSKEKYESRQEKSLDEEAGPFKIDTEISPKPNSSVLQLPSRRRPNSANSSSNSSPLTDFEEYNPSQSSVSNFTNDAKDHPSIKPKINELSTMIQNESTSLIKRKLDDIADTDSADLPSKKINDSLTAPEYDPAAPAMDNATYNPETPLEYDPTS